MIEWNDKEVVEKIKNAVAVACKDGAEKVARDAERLVPKKSGGLARSIEVKESRFKDGGYLVTAQGPGNYDRFYATFVELGTFKDKPQPYLRPALRKNKRAMQRAFENLIKE